MIVSHDRRFSSVYRFQQVLDFVSHDQNFTVVMFYDHGTLIVYALRLALRESVKK